MRHAFPVVALAAGLCPACGEGPAGRAEVRIENFAFAPAQLRVSRGTDIVFTNADSSAHTATAEGFDTGELAQGASATVTATGTVTYRCDIHQYMTGTIEVT